MGEESPENQELHPSRLLLAQEPHTYPGKHPADIAVLKIPFPHFA